LQGDHVSPSDYYSIINEAIDEFYEARTAADPPQQLVGDVREAMDDAFAQKEVSEIMGRLEILKVGTNARVQAWAAETEKTIRERSPMSVCVTREAIRLAREMDYKTAWEMEMRLAQAYCVSTDL
jgi:3-hydroxyisobutyryl-CoA hydrolase